MKKLVFLFVSLFLIVVATENVEAQNDAAATAVTSATIREVLGIEKTQDLNFGDILKNSSGGTLTIATDGTPTPSGVSYFTGSTATTPTAAEFTVTGEPGVSYTLTLSNTSFNVTHTNNSETMLVNNIITTPTTTDGTGTSTLTGGSQTIKVGATLNIGANQATGVYKNTDALKITVAYN